MNSFTKQVFEAGVIPTSSPVIVSFFPHSNDLAASIDRLKREETIIRERREAELASLREIARRD